MTNPKEQEMALRRQKILVQYTCHHAQAGSMCSDCVDKLLHSDREAVREAVEKLETIELEMEKGVYQDVVNKDSVLKLLSPNK